MNRELLLAHFEPISDAPDAIPRLRRFILDLAIRGKLVQQDPNEEPASELLKRIAADKMRLIKEGRIKKQAPLPLVGESVTTFEVPHGWTWTRLGELSQLVTSGSRDWARYYSNDGAIFVRMGNLSRDSYQLRLGNIQHVKPPTDSEGSRTKLEPGDILISITGEVGLLGLIPPSFGEAYINQHTCLVRPIERVAGRYLPELFCSPFAQNQFDEPQRGLKNSFRLSDITHFLVPLPPLSEQHRIVAKVDELMALCDQLEAAQKERQARRDRLTRASLHYLNSGLNAKSFRKYAHFCLHHLPQLTIRPDQILALRQAILSLAVQGRLVSQDPDDESAPITATTKIKPSCVRGMQEDSADDSWPDELPRSWKWYRLGTISEQITDGEHATPPRICEHQIPLVTAKNVRDGCMDYGNTDWVSYETAAKAWRRCRPSVGDLLLVCVGATTGRLCVLREPRDMVLVRSVALIRPASAVAVDYLALVLRSPLSQAQIWEKVKVTAQPCLYINRIKSLSIPLPPLAEQYRIVAKVDELFGVCDQLEAHLTTAQTESSRLLESVLHHALATQENTLSRAEYAKEAVS